MTGMQEKRTYIAGSKSWRDFSVPAGDDPTLIECPSCGKMAKVLPACPIEESARQVRLVCAHCGLRKQADGNARSMDGNNPTDTYFGVSLWMRVSCCGRVLFAFNKRHLDFLKNYVGAHLRKRRQDPERGWSNASMASRLPAWMKSAKNRRAVLKALEKLAKKGGYSKRKESP